MRDGKSLRVAVEAGWVRARTTCLAADAVSLLAAVVLYIFAIGVVKGFAFALGISTVIDLVVFFLFTKPMVTWLARFRFFSLGPQAVRPLRRPRRHRADRRPPTGPVRPAGGIGPMSRLARLGHALYEGRVSIDFVGRKWLWYAISGVILLVAVLGLTVKGLNLGIEFEGGVEYRVAIGSRHRRRPGRRGDPRRRRRHRHRRTRPRRSSTPPARTTSGSRPSRSTSARPTRSRTSIRDVDGVDEDLSSEPIGPSWGQQVAQRALHRARGLPRPRGAADLGLLPRVEDVGRRDRRAGPRPGDHVGVYALSGFEVTPATVTGILTILGFSLYDTVVVFDKVRENTKNLARTHQTYAEAANLAVNQTLVRSINTSIVALLPVGALLYVGVVYLGSGALKDLALALFVGMAAGAYSSIFIATRCSCSSRSWSPASGPATRGRGSTASPRDVDPFAERAGLHRGHAGAGRPGRSRTSRAGAATTATDRPAAGRRRPGAPGAVHRGRARRRRRGRCRTSTVGGPAAADPQAAVAARQEVDAARDARRPLAGVDSRAADPRRPRLPEAGHRVQGHLARCWPTTRASRAVVDALAAAGPDGDGTRGRQGRRHRGPRASSSRAPVALALGAGFVPVRKAGKLPGETHAVSYALEYGEAVARGAPGRASRPASGCWSSTTSSPPAAPSPRRSAGRGVRRRGRRRRGPHGAVVPAGPGRARRPRR